jgi:hypothetical protein
MIVSPVLDYWHERLVNWALWEVSGKGLGTSSLLRNWWEVPPRTPPPLVGEALDTDRLVHRLEPPLFMAVRAHYVWTGFEHEKAAALRISYKTLLDRVRSAQFKLDDLHHAERNRSRNIRAELGVAA